MRIVIQWYWNSYFFGNIAKNSAAEGYVPRLPSVLRLSYTSSVNTSPNSDICTFVLSPFCIAKSWLRAKTQVTDFDLPIYNIVVLQKFLFRKFLMTSLRVICGLGPPFKNPGYAYVWNTLYNMYIFVSDYRNCFGNFEHSLRNFAFVVRYKHCWRLVVRNICK